MTSQTVDTWFSWSDGARTRGFPHGLELALTQQWKVCIELLGWASTCMHSPSTHNSARGIRARPWLGCTARGGTCACLNPSENTKKGSLQDSPAKGYLKKDVPESTHMWVSMHRGCEAVWALICRQEHVRACVIECMGLAHVHTRVQASEGDKCVVSTVLPPGGRREFRQLWVVSQTQKQRWQGVYLLGVSMIISLIEGLTLGRANRTASSVQEGVFWAVLAHLGWRFGFSLGGKKYSTMWWTKANPQLSAKFHY